MGSNSTVTGVHVLSGGIGIAVVDNCTIGGGSVQDRNVVGGCTAVGIDLGGNDNTVKGNYVGVDSSGNSALANGLGIAISGGSGNIVGGASLGERNIISGNTIAGIMAVGTNTSVQGNYIGVAANGVSGIPNGTGVQMQGTGTLGGDLPGERNVISNNQTGVSLGEDGDGNSAVVVKGNYIGTDITGTTARGNSGAGIIIGSAGHRIEHNVISANGTTGVGLVSIQGQPAAINNVITGNKIGTDTSGLIPLPNGVGSIFQGPSNDNIVGEGLLAPYEGNTIAFNTGPGILVDLQQVFGGIPQVNTFRKNSIYNNGDLGIRIQAPAQDNITPPTLDSLKNGTLYGRGARAEARIDVYDAEPDPSGAGEGKTWLANGIALADGSFEIPVNDPNLDLPTATQTDLNRNSSQFSQNLGPFTTGTPDVAQDVPNRFDLFQNYPNPFNPSTSIRYSLPSKSHVTLAVFNTLGQQVAELIKGEEEGGYDEVRFDAANLASGVYFYRIQAGSFVETKRFLLLK